MVDEVMWLARQGQADIHLLEFNFKRLTDAIEVDLAEARNGDWRNMSA